MKLKESGQTVTPHDERNLKAQKITVQESGQTVAPPGE